MLKEIDFYGGVDPVLNFTVHTKKYGEKPLVLEVKQLFHGGRSGRKAGHVKEHLEDLAKFGIPEDPYAFDPPIVFWAPTVMATTSHKLLQYDNATCGEVEPVLLIDELDNIYVTVGSDHDDRHLECGYKMKCKLWCPMVMSKDVWLYEDVRDHWDRLILRYYAYPAGAPGAYMYPTKAERVLGMEGECGQNYGPEDFLKRVEEQARIKDRRNSVIFLGTIPWLGDLREKMEYPFMFSPAYDMELEDPILKRTIRHHHEVEIVWHRVPPNISKVKPPLI